MQRWLQGEEYLEFTVPELSRSAEALSSRHRLPNEEGQVRGNRATARI